MPPPAPATGQTGCTTSQAQPGRLRSTHICWHRRYRWAAHTSVAFSESGACGSWLGVKRSRLVMACVFRGPQRSPETNTQGQNTDGTVQDEVTWLSRQFRGYQPWRRGDTLSLSNGKDDWPEMETHSKSGKKRNRHHDRGNVPQKKKKKVRGGSTAPLLCSPARRGKARGCTATGLGTGVGDKRGLRAVPPRDPKLGTPCTATLRGRPGPWGRTPLGVPGKGKGAPVCSRPPRACLSGTGLPGCSPSRPGRHPLLDVIISNTRCPRG